MEEVNIKNRFEELCDYIINNLESIPFVKVEKKLNKSKYWLMIDLYQNGDYFTFSYTANSPESVRWMFTPDFNIDTKLSKKKKSYESFMKRQMIDIALDLEVSKGKLEVTAQKWKGIKLKIDSHPLTWNKPEIMQQYAKQTVLFVGILQPYIESWYRQEGFF